MTRKCARPNQALELCTGSENTDVIRGIQRCVGHARQESNTRNINCIYNNLNPLLLLCTVDTSARRNDLTLHLLPRPISKPSKVRPQLSGLEAVGYHLPMLAVNSNLIMLQQYTRLPRDSIKPRVKHQPKFRVASDEPSPSPGPTGRYKPDARQFSSRGHTYIMNSLCRRSSGVEQRFRKP